MLDDLLIDLTDKTDEEVISLALELYAEFYTNNGEFGLLKSHDTEDVKFWASRFRHAFFTPKNFHLTSEKQVIDRRRVERIKWIKAVIAGDADNSACWLIEENLTKRLYTVVPKGYVVWLEMNTHGVWTFSTAYTAQAYQIHKYTRGEKRIWKK